MFNINLKLLLCRTCLVTLSKCEIFNIFETLDLAKKLMLCSSLPVEATDEYPENVCLKCYKQIVLFYEFQQMCSKSLDKFNDLLKTTENLTDNVVEEHVEEEYDPLNEEELQLVNVVEKTTSESLGNTDVIEILNNSVNKGKRERPTKKINKQQNVKRNALAKRSCRSIKQKKIIHNEHIDEKPVDTEAIFKFETESEVMSQINVTSPGEHSKKIVSNSIKDNEIDISCYETNVNEVNAIKLLNGDELAAGVKTFSDTDSRRNISFNQKSKSLIKRANSGKRLEVRKNDGQPPYICTIEGCKRSFNRWHFFNKHQKDHNINKADNFKCDQDNCARVYKNKSALNIHKRKYHHVGPELKTHMCEVCGKVFKSSAVLNDHHYTHIDKTQLPYACQEEGCTKRFSNKEKLKTHKMRHEGVKNFTCPFCGMRKTTRNELKIHINYHTLERTWPCRFCSKVFNSAGNLKMHVKNMHERAKDFACRFCERTFAKADTKKYHEMTHTGEKPHECEECGRRFVQPAALRTHRKIHVRQKSKLREKKIEDDGPIEVQNSKDQVEYTTIARLL